MGLCCSKRKIIPPAKEILQEPSQFKIIVINEEPQGRPPPIRIPKTIVHFSNTNTDSNSPKRRAKNKKRNKKMNTR